MSADSWAHAFAYVLANEGSTYVEDPSPTLRGITLETLAAWRGKPCTAADVRSLSLSETQQIYRALYWDKLCGDALTSEAVATAVMDVAANSGVGTGAKLAQQVAGALPDGNIGPKTVAAVNAMSPEDFMLRFVPLRLGQYVAMVRAKPQRRQYLKTWLRRGALYLELIA